MKTRRTELQRIALAASRREGVYPILVASAVAVAFAVQSAFAPVYAQAVPTGGQIAASTATILQTGAQSFQINQGSQNAIVNWQAVSIGAGSVTNARTITTPSGYAALLGPQVSNTGVINARMGTAALAAGDKVSLDMVGDGLISVKVDLAAVNALAINKGTMTSDGGNVLLTARSANALLDTVVNTEGVIRANALIERDGSIFLEGGSAAITAREGISMPGATRSR